MSKIPTAEEFFGFISGEIAYPPDFVHRKAIEFAKLHVQAALEAVSRKQYFIKIPMEYAEGEGCIIVDEYEKLDQWYLPDIYPLENIK